MHIKAKLFFNSYDLQEKNQIDAILTSFGVVSLPTAIILPDKVSVHVSYDLDLDYDPEKLDKLLTQLEIVKLNNTRPDSYFQVEFEEEEIITSPLFNLISIGNNPKLYPQNRNKPKFKTYCNQCQVKYEIDNGPLEFNTSILKKYPIVSVGGHMVISEELKRIFEMWEVTGCDYKLVIDSKSSSNISGFQIIPTNILPKQTLPDYYVNDPLVQKIKCNKCGNVKAMIYPLHYKHSDLECFQDINYTSEYFGAAALVIRKLLISKRLKNLLKYEGLIEAEKFNNITTLNSNEWAFQPVIVTDNE